MSGIGAPVLPERYFAVQELFQKKSLFEVFSFK
jgi:hypothetical protein